MHKPVLLKETVDSLAVKPGGVYIDGTLGRAGHAREILARAGTGARLVGIDRDTQALTESAERLGRVPGVSLTLVHGCHGSIAQIVRGEGIDVVDGVLLDLGVSSPQLDEADRGFSFRAEGPLDMRMDRSRGETAADVVATRNEDELVDLFRTLGEEPNARRIAKAIVKARAAVAVNDELGELERALEGGLGLLKPGGRFAVITFESLTDRMVKRFFAAHVGRMVSLQQGGERWTGELPKARLVTRRAVTASKEEIEENPRARSAKLRTIERIEE